MPTVALTKLCSYRDEEVNWFTNWVFKKKSDWTELVMMISVIDRERVRQFQWRFFLLPSWPFSLKNEACLYSGYVQTSLSSRYAPSVRQTDRVAKHSATWLSLKGGNSKNGSKTNHYRLKAFGLDSDIYNCKRVVNGNWHLRKPDYWPHLYVAYTWFLHKEIHKAKPDRFICKTTL